MYSINRMTRDADSAENILQLVFEKIVLTIHDYSPAKASLFTWMSLIARNEAMDLIKAQEGTGPGLASSTNQNKITASLPGELHPIPFDKPGQPALTPQLHRVMSELFNRGFSFSEMEQVLCLQPCIAKKK